MKKKVLIIIIIVLVLAAIVGTTIAVYMKIDKENKLKKETESNIVEKYTVFRKKVEEFTSERKVYSIQVESDMFKETLGNYDKWVEEIDKYTKTLDDIEEESGYLKDNCVGKIYSNQEVKNKCEAFIIAYETAFNYYTKDLILYNKTLKEITKDEKTEYKEYELKYDYVDINKDGKFLGKN